MNTRTIAFGLSGAITALILACPPEAAPLRGAVSIARQENVPTLHVNVGLVQVEVVVLDDKGKPVAGLKKEDFRVLQDDKEQQISAFDSVREDAPDSRLPPGSFDANGPVPRGKVVLFLFDQSTIGSTNSKLVIDAAENYVRRHRHPADLMGVAIFVQSIRITCPLTHDPEKVIEAIRRANEAFAGSSGRLVQGTAGAKELRSQVVDVFRNLRSLCASLEAVRGRKAVLLFTEDLSVPTDVLNEFDSLVGEARRSDVSFFTLDARGRGGTPTNSASMMDTEIGARPAAPRSTEVNLAQFQNQTSPTILRSLASQTNGYPIFNTDNLDDALDRVDLELGHYYVLGFLSENARSDGKPHKIEVRLNVKDARLKYRDTYTDPHPTDPLAGTRNESPLYAALAQPPATQVPVFFRPVYFFETPEVAQVPVFVKIGRGSIALKKSSGQWTGSASIMGVAQAEDGTTVSRFSGEINVAVGTAQAEAFKKQDLVYRNTLRLRPGKYHLKLVVMDEKGKKGTAEQDLSIPAFNREGLTAGSLIVSQEMVPLPGLIKELKPQMLSRMDPMQHKGFQIYAPVQADMDPQQPLIVFYRIYAAGNTLAGKSFRARVEAISENGESHLFPLSDLASSAVPVTPTETAIGFILPCRDLKPGRYRLRVETVETGSGQSTVSEADFRLGGSGREPAGKVKP